MEESKGRILAPDCAKWYQVLDVSIIAPIEEIKQAFRRLALLHHPDKGGDPEVMRRVQLAWAEGQRRALLRGGPCKKFAARRTDAAAPKRGPARQRPRAKPKAKPKARPKKKGRAKGKAKARARAPRARRAAAGEGEAAAAAMETPRPKKRARPKVLPESASRTKIRGAVNWWASSRDAKRKTLPDDVPVAEPAQVAEWLARGRCRALDARRPEDRAEAARIPGVETLTYLQILTAPEEVAPQIARYRGSPERTVVFSEQGHVGECGFVAAILLDVFGLDEAGVFRLAGGCEAWRRWLSAAAEGGPACSAAALAAPASAPQEAGPHWLPARGAAADKSAALAGKMLALLAQEGAAARLAAARGAQAAALAAREAAEAELEAHRVAAARLGALARGPRASDDEVQAHLSALQPDLESKKLDVSLRAMLAPAASKRLEDRGRYDLLVFEQLQRHFDLRLQDLQAVFDTASAEAVSCTTELQAAEADAAAADAHAAAREKEAAVAAAVPPTPAAEATPVVAAASEEAASLAVAPPTPAAEPAMAAAAAPEEAASVAAAPTPAAEAAAAPEEAAPVTAAPTLAAENAAAAAAPALRLLSRIDQRLGGSSVEAAAGGGAGADARSYPPERGAASVPLDVGETATVPTEEEPATAPKEEELRGAQSETA